MKLQLCFNFKHINMNLCALKLTIGVYILKFKQKNKKVY